MQHARVAGIEKASLLAGIQENVVTNVTRCEKSNYSAVFCSNFKHYQCTRLKGPVLPDPAFFSALVC
jgi:hypothetical protein